MAPLTSPLYRLAALALLAVVAVAVAVLAGGPHTDNRPTVHKDVPLLAGIPQDGIALGDPNAPVTMVEFADLQCPYCREYSEKALPDIVRRYVRTGQVRLELRLLRFLGPDSDLLARTAAGASEQNRMWQVAALAYGRQGRENSGYVDADFLNGLVRDAGLSKVDAGPRAEQIVAAAEEQARRANVESTPAFLIGPTGGPLDAFQPDSLGAGPFVHQIERELSR
jgi:protein-disulfide isomerase